VNVANKQYYGNCLKLRAVSILLATSVIISISMGRGRETVAAPCQILLFYTSIGWGITKVNCKDCINY